MIKKTGIFVLAFIMAFSSVVCIPFLASAEDTVAESEEVLLLKGIGILDDDLDMRQPVTRGMYANYVARLYGTATPSTAAAVAYTDVKADDTFCSAISLLTGAGLLNGCGDGTFKPEIPVTMTAAAKVLVDMLGYRYKANISGGYPIGYNVVAQELGLFKGIDPSQDYVYGNDFALLLYNAIDVDVLSQNGIISKDGDTSIDFEKVKGRTLLNKNLDMYLEEGVIEANSVTNLTDASLGKNQLIIDGSAFKSDNPQYWQMVGCYVEYVYYQPENSNERVLLYAVPEKDSVLTLSREDFISIDGLKIEYTAENGKTKKAVLSSKADFVYNGRVTSFNKSYFDNLKVGEIRLIENTNDSDYDVVMIENYSSFVVDGINVSQMRIDDGITQLHSVSFDSANYDAAHIFDSSGNAVEFESITKGSVVSYFVNGRYLKAYVSKRSDTGTIEAVNTANDEKEYILNGTAYTEPSGYAGKTAEAGDYVTIYVDAFGYVADIKEGVSSDFVAGFMLQGKRIEKSMSTAYGFNIYTLQDKTVELYAADRIDYNGVSTKIEDMPAELPQSAVCYKLNADGKISALKTPVERENYEDGGLFTLYSKTKSYKYGYMLDSKVCWDQTTAMFSVPDIEGDITEKMISTMTVSDMSDRTYYTVDAYGLSADDSRLKVLLVYGGSSVSIPKGENLATIVSLSHTLDENDAEVYSTSVLVEGVAKEFVIDNDVEGIASPADFKPGDSFRYGTNAEGKIHMVDMVYTANDGWLSENPQYYPVDGNKDVVLDYGKVIDNDGTYIRLSFDDTPYTGVIQDYYAMPMGHYTAVTVVTVGARGCTVTKGKIQDAAVGDYIINYRNIMAAVGCVLIKTE